jgi:hypothetical protein
MHSPSKSRAPLSLAFFCLHLNSIRHYLPHSAFSLHIACWLRLVSLASTEGIVHAVYGDHGIGRRLELPGGLVLAKLRQVVHEVVRGQFGSISLQLHARTRG